MYLHVKDNDFLKNCSSFIDTLYQRPVLYLFINTSYSSEMGVFMRPHLRTSNNTIAATLNKKLTLFGKVMYASKQFRLEIRSQKFIFSGFTEHKQKPIVT